MGWRSTLINPVYLFTLLTKWVACYDSKTVRKRNTNNGIKLN